MSAELTEEFIVEQLKTRAYDFGFEHGRDGVEGVSSQREYMRGYEDACRAWEPDWARPSSNPEAEELRIEENARYDYQRMLAEEMADHADEYDYYDGDPQFAPEADYNGPLFSTPSDSADDDVPF